MKRPEHTYKDNFHDWLVDLIHDDALYTGRDMNDEDYLTQLVQGLRSVANEFEKPLLKARKPTSSCEDYNPNDPTNW